MPLLNSIGDCNMYDKMVIEHFDKAVTSNYYSLVMDRRKKYNDAVDDFVMSCLQKFGCGTLLDAGCGTGVRALRYGTQIPGLRVTGIDISPQMILHAQKNGLTDARCCTVTSTEYDDASFDAITCLFFVYCYLTSKTERLAAMQEFCRLLKPGGILIVDCIMRRHKGENFEYHKNCIKKITEFFHRNKKLLLPGDRVYTVHYPDGSKAENYFHAYAEHEIKRLIRMSGLCAFDERAFGYMTGSEYHNKNRGQRVFVLKK